MRPRTLFSFCFFFASILAQIPESIGQIRIKDFSKSLTTSSVITGSGVRSETYTVLWNGEDVLPSEDTTFIGIRSLDVQSAVLDFDLAFASASYTGDAASVDFTLVADSTCAIGLIEHFIVVTADPRVVLINYDFGADSAFATTFSTGTDAELTYTISYDPAVPDLFTTGATAYVSFTRVKITASADYKFDYEILQVTSSSIQLKIKKYGATVLDALKGQILVISSDAIDDLGFATTIVSSSDFSGFPIATETIENTLADISDYYGAPEMAFFLKKWNFESLLTFVTEGELSIDSSDFKPFLLVTQINTAEIKGLDYVVLTFCKKGNDCKTNGFVPQVIAGEANIQNFIGTELGTATGSEREFEFNIAFKRFLGTTPDYFAVGVISGDSTEGFAIEVDSITESSITIQITAPANVAIFKLKVSYIASNWDGLQLIDTSFTPNPVDVGTTREFTQDVSYDPSSSITTPEAFVIFSSVEVDIIGNPIILYSEKDPTVLTNQVRMKITLSADLTFTDLRGFVVVYETTNANKIDRKESAFTTNVVPATTSTSTTLKYPYTPFVFNYINKFDMQCGSFTLEASQSYYMAASVCQMAWSYEISDVCASAFTYQIFTLPSYEASSTGIDFSVFQGTGDICVEATFVAGNQLAVVMTDDAKWKGVVRFNKVMRSVPRFMQTSIQSVSSSGTFAHLTIPTPTFPATGFFAFSVLKLTATSAWNLAGYTGDYMHDFHGPSAMATPEVKNGNFAYGGTDLTQAMGNYKTLVANKYATHDQINAFKCTVRVTFSGIIRALYVDSKFILAGSSRDEAVSVTLNSEVTADFSPNVGSVSTAATVTVIGHYLKITSLDFASCLTNPGGTSITPTFTTYAYDLTYADSQSYYWKVTDAACGTGCLSCLDATTCLECDSSHFLLGISCVYNCNDPTYFIAAKDKFCRSTFANQGLTRTTPSYSGGAISFDVVVSPFRYSFGMFTFIYPKGISVVNYPIIVNDNTKPIALVEGPSKGTIVSVAVQAPLFNAQTVNVVNVASALNQEVRLVTVAVYPDFYYYFTVLTGSGPQFIGYRQSTNYGTSVSMSVSDTYQAHVVYDAPSGGDLTVEFQGTLEVLLNHVTVIFSTTFATLTSYTLLKPLPTGVNYLTFKGTGSTSFNFDIAGTGIKTYNPVSFLHEETMTIPVSSASSISNCVNGAGSVCRSCIGTYYLSPDESECNSNCDSVGGTPVSEERICDGVVIIPPPGPGSTPNKTTVPVPKAVEVLQAVDETRQISNEVFSVVSSVGFQGVHSIRSQTVQGPLGYFMFINIKFPLNYIQFAVKNQDSSMPNPWGQDDNNKDDVDDAYGNQSNIDTFLEDQSLAVNIGETMIYLLVCILIIPVYEGIMWLIMRHKKPETQTKWYHSVLEKGSKSLRWSFLLNQFISKYQDITFFVFLGIYNAGRGENTNTGNTVGSVLGFILVVFIVVGLFFLIKGIQRALKDFDEEQIEKEKFRDNDYLIRRLILFKDFKKDKLMTLLYTFFAVLRVFGFCFCVIFISSVVGIQLAFLNISSFLIIFYLLYYRPFDESIQLKLTLIYELDFYVGVLAATILQIYMSAGGDNETTKSEFGYAIIAADVGMTVLNFISFYMEIKEYAEIAYEYLRLSYKKIKNKNKVTPLIVQEEAKISVKNENLKTEDDSPEMGKIQSKIESGDVTSQELLSPSISISKLVFPPSITDPKRPSLRDRTRQSLMREQVFSIIEAKEENDILIDGSNFKSPKDIDYTHLNVDNWDSSPEGKNSRRRLSKRDARLSISTDKDIAELIGPQGSNQDDQGDNGDVEITKL